MKKIKAVSPKLADGTSLRGYTTATRREIERVFGPPNSGGGDKVSTEWVVMVNSLIFTIYDWKEQEAPSMDETYYWHIGADEHAERWELRAALAEAGFVFIED